MTLLQVYGFAFEDGRVTAVFTVLNPVVPLPSPYPAFFGSALRHCRRLSAAGRKAGCSNLRQNPWESRGCLRSMRFIG
jgi:hypothetical protein